MSIHGLVNSFIYYVLVHIGLSFRTLVCFYVVAKLRRNV